MGLYGIMGDAAQLRLYCGTFDDAYASSSFGRSYY